MKSLLALCITFLFFGMALPAQSSGHKPVPLSRYSVRIRLLDPASGKDQYEGTLAGICDSSITLETKQGEWFAFMYHEIRSIGVRWKGGATVGAFAGLFGGAAIGALMGSGLGGSGNSESGFQMEFVDAAPVGAVVTGLLLAPVGAMAGAGYKTTPVDGDRELFRLFSEKFLLKEKSRGVVPVKADDEPVTLY